MRRENPGDTNRSEPVDVTLTYTTDLSGIDVEITVDHDDLAEAVDFMHNLIDVLEDDEPPERPGPGRTYEGP